MGTTFEDPELGVGQRPVEGEGAIEDVGKLAVQAQHRTADRGELFGAGGRRVAQIRRERRVVDEALTRRRHALQLPTTLFDEPLAYARIIEPGHNLLELADDVLAPALDDRMTLDEDDARHPLG